MHKILLSSVVIASSLFAEAKVLPVEKRTFEQSKFIPDISLIVDASYVHRNVDRDKVVHYGVPGVVHGLLGAHAHDGTTHSTYNANRGFNLNYGELVLSSSVDPYFNMEGVFHLSEKGFEIEEAYFTSTALDHGLRFKGGKFNSNFGYLNEQHHHAWDFADMPLVYESFVGIHGINEKGAQLQWTAPTPFYLMAGVEMLQGKNERMFGTETIGDRENSPIAEKAKVPALYIAYLKASFDIKETTILAGLSYAKGASRVDHSKDKEDPYAFSGRSQLYGADLVIKHYFNSYSSVKLQSEYLYRDMDGTQFSIDTNNSNIATGSTPMRKKQGGLYSQLIYAHNKTWSFGLRYDTIIQNSIIKNAPAAFAPKNMNKYSAMVEYNTSEFARFRLQYNRNNTLYNEDNKQQHIDTLILQANISIGAHAAHSF